MIMIDSELKYCPQCGAEYRSDIVTCSDCNIALISGYEKKVRLKEQKQRLAGRKGELASDDDIVIIHRGQIKDLKPIQELLAVEKIGNLVAGDKQSCGKSCCPSMLHLYVRQEDAKDAAQIIKEEHIRTTGLAADHDIMPNGSLFNVEKNEITCPACGHVFIATIVVCPDCGLTLG